MRVGTTLLKFITLLGLLYLFICSLGFLGDAFKLLGGRAAGWFLHFIAQIYTFYHKNMKYRTVASHGFS